jgi:hypothetical protein
MVFVISGLYRVALEGESGRKNGNEDYTVDQVPMHGRSPRNGHIVAARAVAFVMSLKNGSIRISQRKISGIYLYRAL